MRYGGDSLRTSLKCLLLRLGALPRDISSSFGPKGRQRCVGSFALFSALAAVASCRLLAARSPHLARNRQAYDVIPAPVTHPRSTHRGLGQLFLRSCSCPPVLQRKSKSSGRRNGGPLKQSTVNYLWLPQCPPIGTFRRFGISAFSRAAAAEHCGGLVCREYTSSS